MVGGWLDWIILEVFSNLGDSMIVVVMKKSSLNLIKKKIVQKNCCNYSHLTH